MVVVDSVSLVNQVLAHEKGHDLRVGLPLIVGKNIADLDLLVFRHPAVIKLLVEHGVVLFVLAPHVHPAIPRRGQQVPHEIAEPYWGVPLDVLEHLFDPSLCFVGLVDLHLDQLPVPG